jgi:hypothetical protein
VLPVRTGHKKPVVDADLAAVAALGCWVSSHRFDDSIWESVSFLEGVLDELYWAWSAEDWSKIQVLGRFLRRSPLGTKDRFLSWLQLQEQELEIPLFENQSEKSQYKSWCLAWSGLR